MFASYNDCLILGFWSLKFLFAKKKWGKWCWLLMPPCIMHSFISLLLCIGCWADGFATIFVTFTKYDAYYSIVHSMDTTHCIIYAHILYFPPPGIASKWDANEVGSVACPVSVQARWPRCELFPFLSRWWIFTVWLWWAFHTLRRPEKINEMSDRRLNGLFQAMRILSICPCWLI